MHRFIQFTFFSLAMTFSVAAFAHGPQMQITNNGNKIITRQIMIDDYSPITSETRLFSLPLNPVVRVLDSTATNFWLGQADTSYTEGPGLAFGLDTDPFDAHDDNSDVFLANGNNFEIHLLDALKVWNGTGFVDPGTEEARIFRTTGSAGTVIDTATTTDGGPTNSAEDVLVMPEFLTINSTTHQGGYISILGDGSSFDTTPDDGLYLVQAQLTSSQDNVLASDPYFFLLNKGKSLAESQNAISFLQSAYNISASQIQVIPEPSICVIAAIGIIGLAGTRLRHQCKKI